MIKNRVLTIDLANRFSILLRRDIGAANLNKVVKLNRTEPNPGVCHSHDFCDANMTMLEAYADLAGISQDDVDIEQVTAKFNTAWDIAKLNEFKGTAVS